MRVAAPILVLDQGNGLDGTMAGTVTADDAVAGNETVELGITGDADFCLFFHGQLQRTDGTGRAGLRTKVSVIDTVAFRKIHVGLAHLQGAVLQDGRHQDAAGTAADTEMAGRTALSKSIG